MVYLSLCALADKEGKEGKENAIFFALFPFFRF
jgi:hypothetical protein